MRLVDRQVIDAHLLERERRVLAALAADKALLKPLDLLLDAGPGDAAIAALGFQLRQNLAVLRDLPIDDAVLKLVGDRDHAERRMGDDDGVKVLHRHVGDELLAAVIVEPLVVGDRKARGRVLVIPFLRELREHVVRDRDHRLAHEAEPAHFHDGADILGRLTGAHRMRDIGVAGLDDAGNDALLMRAP